MERFRLEPLISHSEKNGGLRSLRDTVLGAELKLSPAISPRIFSLLAEVRSELQYEHPIDLFVRADASINAFAIYSLDRTSHIISLTSSLVEKMNDSELRFVLGHEIGHIHFQHYRALLIDGALGKDEQGRSCIPNLLRRKLDIWQQLAELSADRCGFAAVKGNIAPIVSAFFKVSSGLGPEFLNFDISAFLHQLEELRMLERRDSICGFSHPATPIRVKALQLFAQAGGASASSESLKTVDNEVTQIAKLMETTPSERLELNTRNFLLAGGVLLAYADGQGFTEKKKNLLIEMLLPRTSDPEADIETMDSAERAMKMLQESATWLKDNAGEERFYLFRFLTHIAAVDGALLGDEEKVLGQIAEMAGIPANAAMKMTYESLAQFMQPHRSSQGAHTLSRWQLETAGLEKPTQHFAPSRIR